MSTSPLSDIERIEIKLDKILFLLTGNGSPEKGLLMRVWNIEQRHNTIDDAKKQRGRDWRAILFPLLTQGLSAGIGALLALAAYARLP